VAFLVEGVKNLRGVMSLESDVHFQTWSNKTALWLSQVIDTVFAYTIATSGKQATFTSSTKSVTSFDEGRTLVL
jgi:hypothetical protein